MKIQVRLETGNSFAILKKLAEKNEQITATGVLEVLQDGLAFLERLSLTICQDQMTILKSN